jgi:L-iditol 2-dehydrogenase
MGCLHVLLARQRGARFIAVTEPDPGRRQRVKALGADLTADPSTSRLDEELLECMGGAGFTGVIFAVSSIEAIRQVFSAFAAGTYRLLAPGARVNLFAGLDPGDTTVPLDARAVHYQGITIVGSVNSTPRQNAEALGLIASGAVDVARLISARVPLARIGEALRLASSKTALKVIVEP